MISWRIPFYNRICNEQTGLWNERWNKNIEIWVTITCSDQNTYIFPKGSKVTPPPTVSIYLGSKHPSSITLPMIPPKTRLFGGTAKIKTPKGNYEVLQNSTRSRPLYIWSGKPLFNKLCFHRKRKKQTIKNGIIRPIFTKTTLTWFHDNPLKLSSPRSLRNMFKNFLNSAIAANRHTVKKKL